MPPQNVSALIPIMIAVGSQVKISLTETGISCLINSKKCINASSDCKFGASTKNLPGCHVTPGRLIF